jgi:hypothetical protein
MPISLSRRSALRVAAVSASVVAAACTFVTDTCACSFPPPKFAFPVSGTVTRADGTPAAAAIVDALAFQGSCPTSGGQLNPAAGGMAKTDILGRFRLEVRSPIELATTCIRVRAFRDETAGAAPAIVLDRENRRIALINDLPVDSLVVTLTLPQ